MPRRNVIGPVAMITVGVLFLLDEFTRYGFHRTWPLILIAIGAALIFQRSIADRRPEEAAARSTEDQVNHG